MTLRRGFKANAERIAVELRRELGLDMTSRLDPHALAEYLRLPVLTVAQCARVAGSGARHIQLLAAEPDSFSAMTVQFGTQRYIIHNESQARTRQANNIVHEAAHCILQHPLSPVADGVGCRCWHKDFEDEANWLAGALLVPREGALILARSGTSIGEIAENFGVSVALCRWRVYQTGIPQQVRSIGSRYSVSRMPSRRRID